MDGYTPPSRLFPGLAVVYGLKAKVYLLDEQYDKAAELLPKLFLLLGVLLPQRHSGKMKNRVSIQLIRLGCGILPILLKE